MQGSALRERSSQHQELGSTSSRVRISGRWKSYSEAICIVVLTCSPAVATDRAEAMAAWNRTAKVTAARFAVDSDIPMTVGTVRRRLSAPSRLSQALRTSRPGARPWHRAPWPRERTRLRTVLRTRLVLQMHTPSRGLAREVDHMRAVVVQAVDKLHTGNSRQVLDGHEITHFDARSDCLTCRTSWSAIPVSVLSRCSHRIVTRGQGHLPGRSPRSR